MSGVEIPNGYGQVQAFWSQANQAAASSLALGFKLTAAEPTESDADDLAEAVADLVCNESTDATRLFLVRITWRLGGFLQAVDVPQDRLGAQNQPAATPQISVLVQKRTGLVGRKFRGRFYLPPPAEALVDAAGQIDADQLTAYQNLVDGFVTDFGGIGSFDGLYLLHAAESTDLPNSLMPQPFGLVVTQYVATQRRRSRRGAF